MKQIVVFFAIAAAFGLQQAESAINVTNEIESLKSKVNFAKTELRDYSENFVVNINKPVVDYKNLANENVLESVKVSYNYVNQINEDAKAENKPENSCVKTAIQKFGELKNTVNKELEKCVVKKTGGLKNLQKEIEDHIFKGTKLLFTIDGLKVSCLGKVNPAFDTCFKQYLDDVKQEVEKFDTTAKNFSTKGKTEIHESQVKGIDCVERAMETFYKGLTLERDSADQCLNLGIVRYRKINRM